MCVVIACVVIACLTRGASVADAAERTSGTPVAGVSSRRPAMLRAGDDFVRQLRQPHTGLIEGQTLRRAVELVAGAGGPGRASINVWIDRKVNPDSPVSPDRLGPTRYASLLAIAQSAKCVCYPVDNCLLIGRAEWVERLASDFFSGSRPGRAGQRSVDAGTRARSLRIDVSWPALTTPNEALRRVEQAVAARRNPRAGEGAARGRRPALASAEALPHDLWPSVHWKHVTPRLARHLIHGQFVELAASPERLRFARCYAFAEIDRWLDSVTQQDTSARTARDGSVVELDAQAATHRALCDRLLAVGAARRQDRAGEHAAGDLESRLRDDTRTFSLKVQNEPAGRVITALAARLQADCKFADSAKPALERRISFSAVDQTLWELLRLIAEEASLKIGVSGNTLQFSAR